MGDDGMDMQVATESDGQGSESRAIHALDPLGSSQFGQVQNRVTIGTITYVCLVKNEAQVTVMQAPADRYSRFAVANCKCETARFPCGAARCACRALMT
jgi:hypothetical protein